MNIRKQLFNFLENTESPRKISGWELQNEMRAITGRNTYPSTLLDYTRQFADRTGAKFICTDRKNSKYTFER